MTQPPDPYQSPYHLVQLPGQQPQQHEVSLGGWPALMPMAPVDVLEWRRPSSMTSAFWFWLVATVLVVIGLPGVFVLDHDVFAQSLINDSIQNDAVPMTRAEAVFAAVFTAVVFGVGLAVLAIPYVIGFIRLRAGASWARVLLAVLGGMGLGFGLLMLAMFATRALEYGNWVYGVIWSLLFLGSTLLGIVLMFLPASNAYVRGSGR
jgi:hypothetical protein